MPPKHKSSISSIFLVLAAIFGISFLLIGGISLEGPKTPSNSIGIVQPTQPQEEHKSIQLGQIPIIAATNAPTPDPGQPTKSPNIPKRQCSINPPENVNSCACAEGMPGPFTGNPMIKVVYCPNERPSSMFSPFGPGRAPPPPGAPPGTVYRRPERENDPDCFVVCFDKPVIYLYPEKPTLVDVRLTIPGIVTKSDPLYPSNGWRYIFALPNGTLFYQGKSYRELFYETALYQKPPLLSQGIVISSDELASNLTDILKKVGLTPFEQNEFLTYWIPRLEKLKSPYIFFSLYTQEQKETFDKVEISPKPDTFIEILAYFKPVDSFFIPKLLELPKLPKRIGFTAVEWGGTIDVSD